MMDDFFLFVIFDFYNDKAERVNEDGHRNEVGVSFGLSLGCAVGS
jgi:hypothetical protein